MITTLLLSLAGAVLAAVIGTLWYMPHTPMGRVHMRFLGFDKLSPEEQKAKMDAARPMMRQMYAAQMALSFITAFAVVFIVGMSVHNGVSRAAAVAFPLSNWLAFMVPVVGSGIIWGNCERAIAWKKFFSDIGCNFVTVLAIAVLASLFA